MVLPHTKGITMKEAKEVKTCIRFFDINAIFELYGVSVSTVVQNHLPRHSSQMWGLIAQYKAIQRSTTQPQQTKELKLGYQLVASVNKKTAPRLKFVCKKLNHRISQSFYFLAQDISAMAKIRDDLKYYQSWLEKLANTNTNYELRIIVTRDETVEIYETFAFENKNLLHNTRVISGKAQMSLKF
jgi:MinD-like ATPase involved in chromosome partitioning or flagellar assembly